MTIRVRKGKLRFVRSGVTSLYKIVVDKNRGAWLNHPKLQSCSPDVMLCSNMPVIGLGEYSDDGYTRVLTSHGPFWVRAMDLTEGSEPEELSDDSDIY